MAGGWSSDGAVQDQIDATIEDAVSRARSALPRGKSLVNCEVCFELESRPSYNMPTYMRVLPDVVIGVRLT